MFRRGQVLCLALTLFSWQTFKAGIVSVSSVRTLWHLGSKSLIKIHTVSRKAGFWIQMYLNNLSAVQLSMLKDDKINHPYRHTHSASPVPSLLGGESSEQSAPVWAQDGSHELHLWTVAGVHGGGMSPLDCATRMHFCCACCVHNCPIRKKYARWNWRCEEGRKKKSKA